MKNTLVVIDTNVFVSALLSSDGKPAQVLSLVQNRLIIPCYDYRIMREYREVLLRPKFGFSEWEINDFLAQIESDGMSIAAKPSDVRFADESDKKFYEIAKQCGAYLVTGNLKHFPDDKTIISAADFLHMYNEKKERSYVTIL